MSRGPGRIERAIENTLRDADRSYSTDELALIAYPGIATVEKKHRVVVLRALKNIADNKKRLRLWLWRDFNAQGRHFHLNFDSLRAYVHGWLRIDYLTHTCSLADLDLMLLEPDMQILLSPGGYWWVEHNLQWHQYYEEKATTDAAEQKRLHDAHFLYVYQRGLATFPNAKDPRSPHYIGEREFTHMALRKFFPECDWMRQQREEIEANLLTPLPVDDSPDLIAALMPKPMAVIHHALPHLTDAERQELHELTAPTGGLFD